MSKLKITDRKINDKNLVANAKKGPDHQIIA